MTTFIQSPDSTLRAGLDPAKPNRRGGMVATVEAADCRLLDLIARGPRSYWWERALDLVGLLGDGWHVILTFLAFWWIGITSTAPLIAGVLLAIACGCAIVVFLKRRFPRARPRVGSINSFYRYGRPAILDCDDQSFPSGHAVNAAALATVLGVAFPAGAFVFAGLAGAIAVARVLRRLHWPSDVAAGLAIGIAVGTLCARALLQ